MKKTYHLCLSAGDEVMFRDLEDYHRGFIRESVLDIPQMEARFGTPRAFNFYMSRKSSKEWEVEHLFRDCRLKISQLRRCLILSK